MRIQRDDKVRVVGLSNLRAMCRRVSGMCHRFWVESVTPNRVKVGYSNPDEYGSENPMYAVFPCWKCDERDADARAVALEYLDVVRDLWHGEGWQAFEVLRDCPELSRMSQDRDEWKTREEWENGKVVQNG